ncbi:MAG: alpha/beta hydrolase [Chloroflexaceae bacterium]|nr:alpha/beta hydrolase [Chloroflexaceae bacterium]
MSAIYLDNLLVHYEVFGRGQPIIFLHSWMGSWRYWVSTMDQLSDRYRAYALDFWGFGESEREKGRYTIGDYAQMLCNFMDKIGIAKANLVGHGMGGMVAIRTACEQPHRVIRVMTVSTPLDGAILKDVTKPGTIARLFGKGNTTSIWSKLVRTIPIDDAEIQQELYTDTESLSERVAKGVHDSMLSTNLYASLDTLHDTPVLAVYGEKDTIVPAQHAQVLTHDHGRPHQRIILPKMNHFPFLENTNTFSRLLSDFLISEGTPVEIKEEWRRRVMQHEYL